MTLSFPTFVVILSLQILLLSGLAWGQQKTLDAKAFALFNASIALYALFRFAVPSLPEGMEAALGPFLANETLPGALLFLYISAALLTKPPRLAWIAFAVPALEVLVRLSLTFTTGEGQLYTERLPVLAGQGFIFILSGLAIWLLLDHRQRYLMQTADNRLLALYLYVAPALLVFILNSLWLLSFFALSGADEVLASRIFFGVLLCLSLAWQLAFLVKGDAQFVKVDTLVATEASPMSEANITSPYQSEWERITALVSTKALYQDPQLTLNQLAREAGINRSKLSEVINQGGKMNFNRFINRLRIDRAKELLRSTDDSVIAIAFECGFNSKPTFNRVFKDETGVTPTAFRAAR